MVRPYWESSDIDDCQEIVEEGSIQICMGKKGKGP